MKEIFAKMLDLPRKILYPSDVGRHCTDIGEEAPCHGEDGQYWTCHRHCHCVVRGYRTNAHTCE